MIHLQHGVIQHVTRRRAPLDPSVTQAVRDALEQGDWLKMLSASGLFVPVADLPDAGAAVASAARVAWPIFDEPSQPDSVAAGHTLIHGDYFAMTDRYAADPLFAAYAGTDTPNAPRVAPAYAFGVPLVVGGFEAAAGGAGAGPLVYGLTTALTAGTENAFAVAWVERAPADNNNLLQFVVF